MTAARLIVVAVLFAVGGVLLLSSPASAAPLSGVIKSVTTTPANLLSYSDSLRTNIAFCVPNGTKAGDTFTLTLPPVYAGLPAGFALPDGSGQVVANATISQTTPAVVTFTMTAYAQSHQNVCGTAFFTNHLTAATAGKTNPLTFTANDGTVFTSSVTVGNGPVIGNDAPQKFGGFHTNDQCATTTTDCISWSLFTSAGATTRGTITDTAPAGETFDCATLNAFIGTASGGAVPPDEHPYTAYTTQCTAAGLTIQYGTVPAGQLVVFQFFATPTLTSVPGQTYSNNATFTTVGPTGATNTQSAAASITTANAGGGANGDNVTINKFSTADGPTAGAYDSAPGKLVAVGTAVPITMTIRNTGSNPLTNVSVTDATSSGPALTGLTCDFTAVGGPSTGTTFAGPLAVGATFNCTGTVPAMPAGTQETDNATVTGTGNAAVTASNPFNSHTAPASTPTPTPTPTPSTSTTPAPTTSSPVSTPTTTTVPPSSPAAAPTAVDAGGPGHGTRGNVVLTLLGTVAMLAGAVGLVVMRRRPHRH